MNLKNRISISYTCFILSIIFLSCKNNIGIEDYKVYLYNPDNGLIQTKNVNNIRFEITYQPCEFISYMEIKNNRKSSVDDLNKVIRKYEDFFYMRLNILSKFGEAYETLIGEQQKYSQLINDLCFNMEDYVYLITSDNDSIGIVDYISPRTYGMAPNTTVLFSFRKIDFENIEWIKLVINDFGLRSGNISFKFYADDIIDAPDIVLNIKQ
ncbi:MAG: hypothetical protein ABIJ97_17695 [Bacteroidota bacterium]